MRQVLSGLHICFRLDMTGMIKIRVIDSFLDGSLDRGKNGRKAREKRDTSSSRKNMMSTTDKDKTICGETCRMVGVLV